MDFTTKPIHLSRPSLSRTSVSKDVARGGKARFKSTSALSSPSPMEECSAMQGFTVTSLDMALLDLSRPPPRQENIDYGYELLDKLDKLKASLLTGTISHQDLVELDQILTSQKLQTTDPKLKEILKEIEIRVAVEIAKHGF